VLLATSLCYVTSDVEDQLIRQLLDSDVDLTLAVKAQSIVCDNRLGNIMPLALLVRPTSLDLTTIVCSYSGPVTQESSIHPSIRAGLLRLPDGYN